MKIRNGFVSNSSSSSFVCDISGESFIVGDDCNDEDTCTCSAGHNFLREYLIPEENKKDKNTTEYKKEALLRWAKRYRPPYINVIKIAEIKAIDEMYKDFEIEKIEKELSYDQHCPITRCPICQMKEIIDRDMLKYLIKKHYDGDEEKLKKIITNEFKNYDELKEYIKE